jgi:uncharacterized protein YceK
MKYIILSLMILLSGCATKVVPIVVKFPEAPPTLLTKCPPLVTLPADSKLSDVAKTVTQNYTIHYECVIKHDAWLDWYQQQKEIFDNVK